jgi:thiol:disulfide interchange protein/DsbC/DsbD-like thiol-disulfide interchange protein
MHMIRRFLILIGFGLLALLGPSVRAQGISTPPMAGNVEVTLLSAANTVAPGESFHVLIEQKIAKGWHTYWRNPGDSGEPTDVTWTLPTGVTAGTIKWPTPTAIPFGPLVNYGYSDRASLPVEITVPKEAAIGTSLAIAGEVRWLECSDICIPGSAQVKVNVSVGGARQDSAAAATVKEALDGLPTRFPGTARLTDLGASDLQLVVTGIDTPREAYFFAHEVKLGAVIDSAQPQKRVSGKDGFGLSLIKSPSFPANLKGPVSGVLVLGKGRDAVAYLVDAAFDAAPLNGAATTPPTATPQQSTLQKPMRTNDVGLWVALLMAFAGGLILNLMPCVLPILSMKALSLVHASHSDARAAQAHGLWYGGGVIVSFIGLAAALIGLQSAGVAIGWGFQLQNPAIVIGLAILMVWIGFNLLGFFEVGTSLQNIGCNVGGSKGAGGSFLTGVLAVIVAAPCTAPFMGAALGFASTQTPLIALLVFGALGLGFALPFVALTFSPGLLAALPKPGPWMIRLREGLAFPMLATAIWLIWVASAQAGQAGVLAGLAGAFGVGLAVWTLRVWPSTYGKALAIVIGLGSAIWACHHVLVAQPPSQNAAAQNTNAWSDERVAQLQSEGKTVFVNFTADWCVTCKVNEVGVFTSKEVRAAFSEGSSVYLVADWTSRDDTIAKALARYNRIGVPLYLVYRPGQSEPLILPQILTIGGLLDAIK